MRANTRTRRPTSSWAGCLRQRVRAIMQSHPFGVRLSSAIRSHVSDAYSAGLVPHGNGVYRELAAPDGSVAAEQQTHSLGTGPVRVEEYAADRGSHGLGTGLAHPA